MRESRSESSVSLQASRSRFYLKTLPTHRPKRLFALAMGERDGACLFRLGLKQQRCKFRRIAPSHHQKVWKGEKFSEVELIKKIGVSDGI